MDAALEWCEEDLLLAAGLVSSVERELPLEKHPLLVGLGDGELEVLRAISVYSSTSPGQRLVSQGQRSDEVFLITSGRVAVNLNLTGGGRHRVATLEAGATFGELALLDEQARGADVDAEGPVTAYVFRAGDLKRYPAVRGLLIERLAGDLATRLRRANAEIAALAT